MKRITRTGAVMATICAMLWMNHAGAELVDCRACHLPIDPFSTVPDFTLYYSNPNHHPVGVNYPNTTFDPDTRFKTPTAQVPGVVFFDTNIDGLPDPNEVQLFVSSISATVECSSCHIEHGIIPPLPGTPRSLYLRIDNSQSKLCYVCHKL